MFYLIILIGIILDLYTKNLALKYLQNKLNILGDFLYLQYKENTGIAFSIKLPFLKIITIIFIIIIIYYYFKEKKFLKINNKLNKKANLLLLDLSFGLILAGAIGNGLERILNEKVIDFIGVKYFSIFNLADSFITIGVILYLYLIFKKDIKF